MKNYLFLLLLFCANITLGQTSGTTAQDLSKYKLDQLQSTGKYAWYYLDLNKDGITDKVLCSDKYQGDELYFFLQNKSGAYHCALKTTNFSQANTHAVEDIYAYDGYLVIESHEINSPGTSIAYYVRYDEGKWLLDHMISTFMGNLPGSMAMQHKSENLNIDMSNVEKLGGL